MDKKIKVKIDNKIIYCQKGQTIMQAAKSAGINIPGLCGHADFEPKANCRICVVEIKGRNKLETSCSTLVENDMEIMTNSKRVKKARNMNIELIFAEHIEKCADCVWRFECKLLSFAEKYKILISSFKDRKKNRKTYKFANAVEIDGSQCIDCRNCIDACSILQNINYLELKGKGSEQEVAPTKNKNIHCILCGQCAVHCPVSAAQEQTHWEVVKTVLKNKKKIVVAQFAPSIRVSIGEDFGLDYGKIMTGHVVAGLRKLGFNYVFDVNFGADVTTMVEAEELLNRLKGLSNKQKAFNNSGPISKLLPIITSCCPAWVNYVEFYHPELIPNLTTARSPQIHSAGLIKTYWARKKGVDPKDIVVVSIMPCTAKKYEASRAEMKIGGQFPVDYVLTTREFSFMLKKNNINFLKLKASQADNPLGEYSGAAAIYGASGGVMESALRTAYFMACDNGANNLCAPRIEFKQVRGMNDVKEASFHIGDKDLRVVVVNGIKNVEPVIENLDSYDYIEVMACPGGCIGGGGQPIPTNDEIRKKRIAALYQLDKKKLVRMAHDNQSVLKALKWVNEQGNTFEHSLLHTKYKKKNNY
ncbi:MAG: [FeFe] hydrogenase, group A [Patescibacteria group bacterium]|nr:[FeFe] hydrogenase, group A [Patescibacteria group bacterium]